MLRVAVLGAGRIGKIHAVNAASRPDATLVTVADPRGAAARDLASRLGCEASLDPLAVIGTPTDTHLPRMLHAVRRGKAVLSEKLPGDRTVPGAGLAQDRMSMAASKTACRSSSRSSP